MTTLRRDGGASVRAGVAVLTFAVMAVLVLVAAPLSLVAPYAGMYFAGLESPWVAVGSGVTALLLFAVCARTIILAAIVRWPDCEKSFRIGVLAVPAVALAGVIVALTVDWPPGAIAFVALPAAFAVSIGAAAAWIGVRR